MTLSKLKTLTATQLITRFPFMAVYDNDGRVVQDDGLPMTHFMDWGWRDIQLALAEHIKPIYDKMDAKQKKLLQPENIKEKYGTMRHSFYAGNDGINAWVDLAEYVSSYTCIECGATKRDDLSKEGRFIYWESQGWICPYCGKHREDSYVKRYADAKCKLERWQTDFPKQTIEMDVGQFWDLPEED